MFGKAWVCTCDTSCESLVAAILYHQYGVELVGHVVLMVDGRPCVTFRLV